jgi:hypothetical protein
MRKTYTNKDGGKDREGGKTMCPYFDPMNQHCKLSELYKDASDQQAYCMTNDAWRRCGNAEAKASGSNYQDRPR